jgi:oxygen-dependent protoporphyrinogen oxidase
MKGKAALLVGGAVGYVLGTRAGRQRYEQIKGQAQKVWQNPKVQQTKAQAQDYAREKAPEVQHKVADAAAAAKEKVQGSGGAQDVRTSDPADPSSPSYETSVSSPTTAG